MRPLPVETRAGVARAVGLQAEDLVAGVGRMGGLEDQLRAVGRPVGLGVLAAAGELAQVRPGGPRGGRGSAPERPGEPRRRGRLPPAGRRRRRGRGEKGVKSSRSSQGLESVQSACYSASKRLGLEAGPRKVGLAKAGSRKRRALKCWRRPLRISEYLEGYTRCNHPELPHERGDRPSWRTASRPGHPNPPGPHHSKMERSGCAPHPA